MWGLPSWNRTVPGRGFAVPITYYNMQHMRNDVPISTSENQPHCMLVLNRVIDCPGVGDPQGACPRLLSSQTATPGAIPLRWTIGPIMTSCWEPNLSVVQVRESAIARKLYVFDGSRHTMRIFHQAMIEEDSLGSLPGSVANQADSRGVDLREQRGRYKVFARQAGRENAPRTPPQEARCLRVHS